jgi:hypothetical protein
MSWKDTVARIIGHNLKWSPASDSVKAQIVAEAIDTFENPPPEESKPQDAPSLTVRGESLESLRKRAHEWAGWESRRK